MPDRIKILLLIPHLGGGGAEQVTALLAAGLSERNYEVHLGLVTQSLPVQHALPSSVQIHALSAPRVRHGAMRILALVRRLRPDVILSGMFHLNFLVLMLRPLLPTRTRVIVRQNGTVSASLKADALPWYISLLYRLLYRFADCVVCQSRAMADDLVAELGLASRHVAVLPNPIDFEQFTTADEPADWPGPGPHLLAVGRLSPEKGLDLLLKAFAVIRRDHPPISLVILGKGPDESKLKNLAADLLISDAVHFAGHVDRPARFYAAADLFVLSSRHEGMPNALIEALAAGLPVVATPASGGVVDLLRRRTDAWLAQDTGEAALLSAMTQAIENLEARNLGWDRMRSERRRRVAVRAAEGRFLAEKLPQNGCSLPARHSQIGEFAFERAFEAYESLIVSLCMEGRP